MRMSRIVVTRNIYGDIAKVETVDESDVRSPFPFPLSRIETDQSNGSLPSARLTVYVPVVYEDETE